MFDWNGFKREREGERLCQRTLTTYQISMSNPHFPAPLAMSLVQLANLGSKVFKKGYMIF
jgi:hypothetical protein